MFKIEILRRRLGDRRIRPVGTSHRTADAKAPLRKIQAVTACSADPVRLHPFDQGRVHAALQNEIFHQHTDFIIRKSRDYTGL